MQPTQPTQLIGIDLGTSYIKGGVLDLETCTIHHVARRPFPAVPPDLPPMHHEVDPAAVVNATRALLEELVAHVPVCAGILVSSQMHGCLLTDREGTPLTRLITWQDQRALVPMQDDGKATPFAALEALLEPSEILALGNGFKASLPLCALYTLAQQEKLPPDAAPETVVWSLADYVLTRLAEDGEFDAVARTLAEPTIAASFGAYDFATQSWRHELLAKLGLDRLHWPRIADATTPVGAIAVAGQSIPVYPALGDHQCATLGSLLQPGELALNISTGSQVSTLAAAWLPNPNYESRPYFGGQTLNTVTRVPAGRALTALVNLLTEIPRRQGVEIADPWTTLAQAVESTPATDLEVNLSFFAGAFGAAGSIGNIHEANLSIGHLLRAAFQHMSINYAQCADWLGWSPTPSASSQTGGLVFAGGLAQNFPALRTIITERLHAPARISPHAEDTLLGLLILGLVIEHHVPNLDAACTRVGQTLAN